MDDCIIRLNQLLDQLTPTEARAARLLLEQGPGMMGLTIDQMALACGVSKSTLVRLAKRLGYKGFKEFSLAFSIAQAAGGNNHHISFSDLSITDDLPTISASVTQCTQNAIQSTMSALNMGDLERAVSLLHKARRVDFYGVGVSALVALDAQMKFQRLGKETQGSFDPHIQVVTAATLRPGNAAVLFSYSGETSDTLDTLASVRRSGASVITLTRLGSTSLSEAADVALYVASSEMLMRTAAMSSRICMMHLIDIIFSAVAARGYERYRPQLDRTHREGNAKRRISKTNKGGK